jgi:hypothetical protein
MIQVKNNAKILLEREREREEKRALDKD